MHIPKNAGTYVLSWTMKLFRYYAISKGYNNKVDWNLNLRRILLQNKGKHVATVFVHDPHQIRITNPNFIQHQTDRYCSIIDTQLFLKEIKRKKIQIFSVIIESDGANLIQDGVWDNMVAIVNATPLYYTVFREVYDRSCSLYSYITSNKSVHEPTHDWIKSNSLKEYLLSYELSDSWLIRTLTKIPDNQIINEDIFNKACIILDRFKITDIKYTDDLFNVVFQECYNINQNMITDKSIDVDKNSTCKNKVEFDQLDQETKNAFLQRTEFDRKIYEKYCLSVKS